jgi:hypothetical protein
MPTSYYHQQQLSVVSPIRSPIVKGSSQQPYTFKATRNIVLSTSQLIRIVHMKSFSKRNWMARHRCSVDWDQQVINLTMHNQRLTIQPLQSKKQPITESATEANTSHVAIPQHLQKQKVQPQRRRDNKPTQGVHLQRAYKLRNGGSQRRYSKPKATMKATISCGYQSKA